ncbi:chemotaxis protein CheA [Bradyrhizobium sp. 62B]|uniref:chemotaxis protein CheA n=1 Tax=Bradyrhizobium sp. 62B TaxID=2898442 RepID=UPI0025582AB3|nr:chemotaxis protein CheA [Bradyrhizobium sp. 62B]
MNEFVEQFLLEARELVEQGTNDLLALEKGKGGKETIDALFRAFHTLKGAAGIVEFAAMGRALHAAEETLSEVRNETREVTPTLVDDCLGCLDQITRWLDEMETTGEPPSNADAVADVIVDKFVSKNHDADDGRPRASADGAWYESLRNLHGNKLPAAGVALHFRPDADAFFRGEDPLARLARVPELVVVDLALPDGMLLDEIDPFSCVLEIVAVSRASKDLVWVAFEGAPGVLDIVELHANAVELRQDLQSLLQAQVLLLNEKGTEGRLGRMAAAGRATINILQHEGLLDAAARIATLLETCLVEGDATTLIAAIQSILDSPTGVESAPHQNTAVRARAPTNRVMRIESSRIDALVNLAGELTVTKNAFGHIAALVQNGVDPKELLADLREQQARLDRLVGELQRSILKIRVLPLRQVFQRFPRLVREISASIGKSVTFVAEGESTEADATVVESLFEPLLHIIRNAIDHGSEDPATRKAVGKAPSANIVLRARRQLENVIVEVEDDGRGIDVRRIREVAADRDLLPQASLSEMSDNEIMQLIFAPGFSTSTEVTGLSGRGVGLDSVKAAVERIGGTVGVESYSGQGSKVRLTLPFTVMVTKVMTAEAAGQVFGFALDTVVETASVPRKDLAAVGRSRAFVLRDRTIPLINLAESLGLPESQEATEEAKIVVTSSSGYLGGIEVDRLGERMDIMLKPMDGLLKNMPGVAGTTLLGDGRVLIVLDVQELFE